MYVFSYNFRTFSLFVLLTFLDDLSKMSRFLCFSHDGVRLDRLEHLQLDIWRPIDHPISSCVLQFHWTRWKWQCNQKLHWPRTVPAHCSHPCHHCAYPLLLHLSCCQHCHSLLHLFHQGQSQQYCLHQFESGCGRYFQSVLLVGLLPPLFLIPPLFPGLL